MNTEKTQKYDPNRLFKKGDKVRVQQFRGRCGSLLVPSGNTAIVIDSEDENCLVVLENPSRFGKPTIVIHSCFLELVTPVEEKEPYVICENDASYEVRLHSKKENHTMAIYNKDAYGDWQKARYAAEAECKRLNKEYSQSTIND